LFLEERRVRVSIRNTGNRIIELVEAELLIPQKLSGNNVFNEYQPVLQRRSLTENGVRYVGNALTTTPSTLLHLGVNPLRQMLAPGAEYVPEFLGANLPAGLSPEDEELAVRCTVSAKRSIVQIATPIKQISAS
jgi:hypothetical protein